MDCISLLVKLSMVTLKQKKGLLAIEKPLFLHRSAKKKELLEKNHFFLAQVNWLIMSFCPLVKHLHLFLKVLNVVWKSSSAVCFTT